jgi:hypothetical protein
MSSGKQIEFTLPNGTKIMGKDEFANVTGITMYRLAMYLRRGGTFFEHKGKRYDHRKILKVLSHRDYIPNPLGRRKMGRPVTKVKPPRELEGDDYRVVGNFVMKYSNEGKLSKTYPIDRFELYLNTLLKFVL